MCHSPVLTLFLRCSGLIFSTRHASSRARSSQATAKTSVSFTVPHKFCCIDIMLGSCHLSCAHGAVLALTTGLRDTSSSRVFEPPQTTKRTTRAASAAPRQGKTHHRRCVKYSGSRIISTAPSPTRPKSVFVANTPSTHITEYVCPPRSRSWHVYSAVSSSHPPFPFHVVLASASFVCIPSCGWKTCVCGAFQRPPHSHSGHYSTQASSKMILSCSIVGFQNRGPRKQQKIQMLHQHGSF